MNKLFIFAAILFLSLPAAAGTLEVTDKSMTLDPVAAFADVASKSDQWPFFVKVIMDYFPNKTAVDAASSACVQSPNDVCIVIDPKLRSVFVHFGIGTGVSKYDFNAVATAGNKYFKESQWAAGVERIIAKATQAAAAPPPTVASEGFASWQIFLFFLFLAVLAIVVWGLSSLGRKQKKLDDDMGSFREERNEMALNNGENLVKKDATRGRSTFQELPRQAPDEFKTRRRQAPLPIPSVPGPTVIVQNNGGSDFATGFLVGQASAPAPSPAPRSSWPSPSPSPAPSSPSWGGFGGGSSDSGGGGGDFGGGGGSDGGGGGGDF